MAYTKQPATQTSKEVVFDDSIVASLVINGDLGKLDPGQKVAYYRQFCERLGLDPLSQPFKLLRLNGKEILYCGREGSQQLNKLHHVSHTIKAREVVSGCYVVTAQASTPEGRCTESIGAVPVENLRGDALCNAMMKAETKAKRRATLDLLGLGMLDELETEAIPNAAFVDAPGITPQQAGLEMQAPAAKQVSPFKKKYETVEEIESVLNTAVDVKDIANLFYLNAEMVEGNADLKSKFTAKKNEFYGSMPSEAILKPDGNGGSYDIGN